MQSCIAIDDDPLMLQNYKMILNEIPWIHLTETFTSPVKAASAIITIMPDIIFLDINMPHVEGYALLDWIKPRLEEMQYFPKIIIVSADLQHHLEQTPYVIGQLDKSAFIDHNTIEQRLAAMLS